VDSPHREQVDGSVLAHTTVSEQLGRGRMRLKILEALEDYGYGQTFWSEDLRRKTGAPWDVYSECLQDLVDKGLLGRRRIRAGVWECWRVEPPKITRQRKP